MNFLKIQSFWVTLITLAVILFILGMYEAPSTVTTCIPDVCNNEWGTTISYRAEVGLLALGSGIIPVIVISLLVAYFLNRKNNKNY